MASNQINTSITSESHFYSILEQNPGLIIIKFGADWCKPCQKIKNDVNNFFVNTPSNIICFDIDVDKCEEIYHLLRKKRMISGIPAILCYKIGNVNYAPDDSFSGTNLSELNNFFKRCVIYSNSV
jgi:thioredoxin-like negative regulator of GroEL